MSILAILSGIVGLDLEEEFIVYLNAMRRVAEQRGISMEELAKSVGANYKKNSPLNALPSFKSKSHKSSETQYMNRPME